MAMSTTLLKPVAASSGPPAPAPGYAYLLDDLGNYILDDQGNYIQVLL